jgi:2,4-didehydro-3-deoxy-L-rhamnonate hydrolase
MSLAVVDGRAAWVRGNDLSAARAADLHAVSGGRFGPDPMSAFAEWDALSDWAMSLDDEALGAPIDLAGRVGAPVPSPRQVFAVGLNYRAHAEESGMEVPKVPATFTKFPSSITGPGAQVALPSNAVDYEVELVFVIGRGGHRIAAADGWSHVAGLTIGQDLSERKVQFAAGNQFSLGKSYPGFSPIGPLLVTPDEVRAAGCDPDDLELGCRIGDEVLQRSRTSDLAFSVPQLVEELSRIVTLLPGDVVFTGTPAGVGVARKPSRFLAAGERLVSWIDGLGELTVDLVAGTDQP